MEGIVDGIMACCCCTFSIPLIFLSLALRYEQKKYYGHRNTRIEISVIPKPEQETWDDRDIE